jgi:hypothetical protein
LLNPFIEHCAAILNFAATEVGLSKNELKELLDEVAVKCLEIGCKVCLVMFCGSFSNLVTSG